MSVRKIAEAAGPPPIEDASGVKPFESLMYDGQEGGNELLEPPPYFADISLKWLWNRCGVPNSSTANARNVPMDAVIVAIGHKTSPTVFKSLTLATEARFIKTDTNFKTSVDGVYAVGDITEVSNEPRFALLALGGAQAYVAINNIKKYLVPQSALFGGHSSELKL